MSRRNSSSRRKARRDRQQNRPEPVLPDREITPEEWVRICNKYRCLKGRGGVTIGWEPMGPTVDAKNPQELKAATEQALIDETLKQDPS